MHLEMVLAQAMEGGSVRPITYGSRSLQDYKK